MILPLIESYARALNQMPLRARALFLMMESSGMRIGEATKLQMDDIDLNANPGEIRIRAEYTKGRIPRTVFISAEATKVLLEWLKVREHYIDNYSKSGQFSTRIFPVRAAKISRHFNVALDKTGLNMKDKSTNRRILHPRARKDVNSIESNMFSLTEEISDFFVANAASLPVRL